MEQAVAELQKATALAPTSVEYRYNLGFVMGLRGNFAGALAALQKAVELSEGRDPRCLAALAEAYNRTGHPADAIQSVQRALELALQEHDEQQEKTLRGALERYERDGAKAQPR
jgi:tetratricopeptide (TPR) repeat protein